jgi:hypothetical protein
MNAERDGRRALTDGKLVLCKASAKGFVRLELLESHSDVSEQVVKRGRRRWRSLSNSDIQGVCR